MSITRLLGRKIVDTTVRLIFRMGHRASCFPFCVYRLSILLLCITTEKLLLNYQANKTKTLWPSVDSHFQDGAGSVLLSLLAKKGGNTFIMCIHYQIEFWLHNLQHFELVMLLWCSLCHRRNRDMEPFTLAYDINNGHVAAFCAGHVHSPF